MKRRSATSFLLCGTTAFLAVALGFAAAACGGDSGTSSPTVAVSAAVSTAASATSVASVTPAPSRTPEEDAESAFRRQFDEVDKGQWGREWDELHPAQQALVTRDHFIDCRDKQDIPSIDNIDIVEIYQEDIGIPGTTLTSPSTAITATVKVSRGLLTDESTDTYHEFNVDGVWRWTLSSPEDYKNGGCPAA